MPPKITSLAFLTPGNFADDDPYPGLEETLRLFEYGERLGFDGARQRPAAAAAAARPGPGRAGLVRRRSLRSMRWAGEQGLNLLTGNIVTGETSDEFTAAQLALIKEYRSVIGADRPARVALGRVIVPYDSATAVTRTRYRDYAASRYERTLRPQPPGGCCSRRT